MPKNIILFHHHNEPQVGDCLSSSLKTLHDNGFDTICIESDVKQPITKTMINAAVAYKKSLIKTVERQFNFKYDAFDRVNLEKLSAQFIESPLAYQMDFRAILNLTGELSIMKAFQQALAMDYIIKGIDYDTSRMTSAEALRNSDMREARQFANLLQLNKNNKNCIVLLGAHHFKSMHKNISASSPLEQKNNLLAYVHTNSLLMDELKSEEWYQLRDRSNEYASAQCPIKSYNISTPELQHEFVTSLSKWVQVQENQEQKQAHAFFKVNDEDGTSHEQKLSVSLIGQVPHK